MGGGGGDAVDPLEALYYRSSAGVRMAFSFLTRRVESQTNQRCLRQAVVATIIKRSTSTYFILIEIIIIMILVAVLQVWGWNLRIPPETM
jgi:hypothetical protein